MTDDLPAHRTAKLGCGHRMCHSCLKRQFVLSVNDPAHMPPTCCTAEHIPLKYVERLFDDKFKKLWNKKFQEYTTKNRIYCPTRGCGEWIKPSKVRMDLTVGRKYAQCGRCRTRVCVLCNGKFHMKKECPKDEETKQLVEMAHQKGWQRCYNCKTMVELKEGCNHMTCRCTAQFCMLCAARWKTCNCPWFNYTNLDDGDRLNEMRVPYDPQNQVVVEIPTARPRGFTNWSTRDRRAQERADEALARHLQSQLQLSSTPTPSDGRGATVQVYGVGNAGSHHLNESYAVRPLPSAAPRAAVSSPPAPPPIYRRRLPGTRELGYEEPIAIPRPPPEPEPAPPNAARMAGLAKDGSRRGAARVNVWLQHVQYDPAEVEGRGSISVGGGDDW
ncbi:uncharacterized protein BDZ99DRAFT_380896 [Mytilinidion resinicola]|uniref:RBR-type E3 ubiquitin transferase n=1 Tax=Mytilinidion resinicola TaxID=574789 RepID=A0A6A6Z0H6_9PEZI|nr:uncharacterized protein BDZ99DRAFT_380896 [Mytilinidion resinicola]KAF2814203.1 hypothetical protein BDZ99DRAFT_380896 [Mytilinidion resinicola]